MMDKYCIVAGCKGLPLFGFGLPLRGPMAWACREHRSRIWTGADAAPKGEGRAEMPNPVRSSPPSQGRLF